MTSKLPEGKNETIAVYQLLLAICEEEHLPMASGYKQLRDLLERMCRIQMQSESLQMTDLSARISFVSARMGLSIKEQNRLHTFRLTSNQVLNRQLEPTRDNLLRDVKTLVFFARKLFDEAIPEPLYRLLPHADATYLVASPSNERIKRMRVCFQSADGQYLYVTPMDELSDTPYRVRYNVPQVNEEFVATCASLWRHAQLNLLDVMADKEGILTPSFIVLEPDYLIDISSLAECFRLYGQHPGNYILSRIQPIDNARPLLLGNIVNLFLDEWIYAKGNDVDYRACMRKAFQRYPIELAACVDLQDKEKEQQFFDDCKMHFDHIRDVVTHTFNESGYDLDRSDAVLEPSYICEALGLQGRLDYMQRDMSSFIEMKSGKGDEFTIRGKVGPNENNKVQMMLYQAVLQYSMGIDHGRVKAYLLYTKYPLLYPARPSWAMVRRAIELRNRIVADEYGVQLRNSIEYTAQKLEEINATTLNERGLEGKLWEGWLKPSIDGFQQKLQALSLVERNYFYALYNFITKELYTSKSGDIDYDSRAGAASLWLSTFAEKMEGGEIIPALKIKENHAADEHKAYLVLVPSSDADLMADNGVEDGPAVLPNFRQGDAVVLYERNANEDNVTNKMIFKGNIESFAGGEIRIRLRATQRNQSVLPAESCYALEHDTMDTAFRTMYLGLHAFLTATQDRRDLLLSQRLPQVDESLDASIAEATDDFTRIALKAKAAKDYFLLVGPPGTGKTSCALKKMVELFHEQEDTHILLLAYTNRAVDEICKSIASISPAVDFIRVGSELSCDEAYREHLLENKLSSCNRRADVSTLLSDCRIVLGTVAAISGKTDLFRLKHFDVAIIDEATQILEPQLLGILCARNGGDRNAIDKFVLIGDHKQLPAVVLQRAEHSAIYDESLKAIGLVNLKDSLFERLYRNNAEAASSIDAVRSFDLLRYQGRMHPEVALFANRFFYGGQLLAVGLPHQTEVVSGLRRVAFYPSTPEKIGCSVKINSSEAHITACLVSEIYKNNSTHFDASRTLGIVTPYRSQIALIKKEIEKLDIPELRSILVDTVERFQGSERDVIIYSFCINQPYQLEMLPNVTEVDGVLIDRKLNVALTRARKQLIITGVPSLLNQNPLYKSLLDLIKVM